MSLEPAPRLTRLRLVTLAGRLLSTSLAMLLFALLALLAVVPDSLAVPTPQGGSLGVLYYARRH